MLVQILINNINMPINHKTEDVLFAAQEIVRQHCVSASNFLIYKQSIDARRKSDVHFVYSVSAHIDGESFSGTKNIALIKHSDNLVINKKLLNCRPVVIGMGPCGLFAAYILAMSGNPPLIIERGDCVENRVEKVERFWETGILDRDSNVQFGEGGAGAFSDGKINTGIGDKRQRFILKTFVKFGAPDDILYKSKPHIGTDKLRNVLVNMRRELIDLGCEIRFNSIMTNIRVNNGKISEIELNNDESISCDKLLLAIGHSSRDTYEMLNESGVKMDQKPFAAGVRIEHKQSFIGMSQYGECYKDLPPADYKLTYNGKDRSCYSFCMCPGGVVVNASSEDDRLVVNGMSNYLRDADNANSALVVNVKPSDFGSDSLLAGMEFQRKYEELAFKLGGSDYSAPVQLAKDFAARRVSDQLGDVKPSFTGAKTTLKNLRQCLPKFISRTLSDALRDFNRKIDGYTSGDAVLTGIEMRTSAPIRLLRTDEYESVNVRGLYPIGEGAGYAGGIVSAALDGIKAALSIIK